MDASGTAFHARRIKSILNKIDETLTENGNIAGNTAMGAMLKIGSEMSKWFYLNDDEYLTDEQKQAHINGSVHIHKVNCGFTQ